MSTTTASSPATADLGHAPGSAAYRRVVAALFAAGLATFALLYSTQALLPEISADLGVSSGAATLTVSLTTVGLALALLVAGPLSDRVGRTPLVHTSLAASAVVALLCAVAPGWTSLLALRLLLGVTLAGLPAVATSYLREELHPGSHARAAGVYIGGTAIGGMAGRLVTGGAADLGGWRWGLAATGLLALACAVAVRLLLPPSRRFVPRAPRGSATAPRSALADPALLALYAVGACSVGAMVAVFNLVSFRLTSEPFGLGVGLASLVFLTYAVGTASSVVAGRAADRWGRRAVVPVGAALALAGVLLTLPDSLVLVVGGTALLCAGFFAVHGVASGWVPARAHAGRASSGAAAADYLFAYYVGSSVFGSLAGVAWGVGAWPAVVALAAALLTVAGGLALVLRRTTPLAPEPTATPATA
ncbi:MFS transporter [Nocardioides litoris]|uniref:MFS transporter n=1 Tax=Nocardioides litoris TaxID=1926648 RepID=UPI001FE5602F|nr:MFS transporter [Nocardioides litoris]